MALWYEREDGCVVIQFGKHSGEIIQSIPDSYLRWMDENIEDDPLRLKVQEELAWRESTGAHVQD